MYVDFFGLHEKPFNVTPDPSFLYLSKKHQEALAHLTYGIKERKGFIAVTGEIGAGKTTLCRTLLSRMKEKIKTAYILNSNITSDMQLLRMIIDDFGIEPKGKNKVALLKAMNEFLIEQTMQGNNVVIIIDEAQNLRPRVIEQIRMLSNLETDKEKLLQIVFVGQPELKDLLRSPKLIQLNQRITVRYHVSPLDREEVQNYINHRLSIAGSNGYSFFSKEAVDEVYNFSGGIPRLINIICDRALLLGFVKEQKDITDEMIKKSSEEVEGLH
jgi:general secretion pathway protein A